jgi:hypothetical protein
VTHSVDAITQHAFGQLEEILNALASGAYVEEEYLTAVVAAAEIRSAYERIVQQVFPLVAIASVLEANAGYIHYASELAGELYSAVEGFMPPSPEGTTIEQLSEDELTELAEEQLELDPDFINKIESLGS